MRGLTRILRVRNSEDLSVRVDDSERGGIENGSVDDGAIVNERLGLP